MRKPFAVLLLLFLSLLLHAQVPNRSQHRLKVFIDCKMGCDHDFIKTEINIVDFLLDNQAADVHVLITEQSTGSGGDQFQLIFFGQNRYKKVPDTLGFNTDPNATDFEERDLLIKYLKLGLTPYIVRAGGGSDISIEMKKKDGELKTDSINPVTKDPWNYWVYRAGAHGYLNEDQVYKTSRFSANLAANRVTEELKVGIEANAGRSRDSYNLEDSAGNKEKVVIKNEDYNFQQYLIKSINDHWSWGYRVALSRSTFSNNKNRLLLESGIEYDIFPYKQVNTKFFTISYVLDVRRNNYYDTTLYNKTEETLFGQALQTNVSFRQKWGTISLGSEYHNYLHNWQYFNLSADAEVDIRITGGLTLNFYTSAALIRDQIYLPKEEASQDDVLTRRRQIASNYSFYISFGLNYRFGSKLNNFVNPRFD